MMAWWEALRFVCALTALALTGGTVLAYSGGDAVEIKNQPSNSVARLTRMLLGFGLRHFSMHPAHLLGVKQRVLTTSLPDIAPIVARILKTDEPEKMQALIEKLNA